MQKQRERDKRQMSESNIQVAIRVRPLNNKQQMQGDWDVVRVQDKLIIILDPIQMEFEAENKKMLEVLHRSKEQRYAFDKIYRDQESEIIYQETVQPLIKSAIAGRNATVFAYGPTGTGKTYTMLGNEQVYGLNVLAIRDVFSLIEEDDSNYYQVVITYVEIYNQTIRDLLVQSSGYLQLRDQTEKGVMIAGVTQFKAESTEQVIKLLHIGNKRRTTEATNANQTSSRSHAVFQINISRTSKTKNTVVQTLVGKLSLIDLAGSQRGTVTENRGIRLMEGAKINRSLLALANCINALGDKNKKGFFVPYRDSKLTRLLKDSLGGNSKTVMIANISPASAQFEQTINTLKYANRAKNIKTKQVTNKKLVSIHISQYKKIINDLRLQIQQLKFKLQKPPQLTDSIDNNNDSHPPQQFPRKEGAVVCQCGKIQQSGQIKKIKEQIFQNFNQRIQLRKGLLELQEQNSLNILDIKRKKNYINSLKSGQLTQQEVSQQIQRLRRQTQTLKLNTHKNILKKQIMNLQLIDSMNSTKRIRNQILKRVKSKQNREFLEIIIKNHVLQLQNIELQINLKVQEKIIGELRNVIVSQKQSINAKGVLYELQDEQNDALDNTDEIQLQIDEDSQGNYQDGQFDLDQEFQPGNEIAQKKSFKRNKSMNKLAERFKQAEDVYDNNREKPKRFNQQSENFISLGKKKQERQKTMNNASNNNLPPNQYLGSTPNIADFNLKGVNVRLNQKAQGALPGKERKKK